MRLAVEALPELGSVVDKDVGQCPPSLVPGTTLYAAVDMHMAKTESEVLERSGIFDLVEHGTLSAPHRWLRGWRRVAMKVHRKHKPRRLHAIMKARLGDGPRSLWVIWSTNDENAFR